MSQTDAPGQRGTEDTTTDTTFHLQCTDCSFRMTIEVGSMDALEIADSHQAEYGDSTAGHRDHFVAITSDQHSEYVDR